MGKNNTLTTKSTFQTFDKFIGDQENCRKITFTHSYKYEAAALLIST